MATMPIGADHAIAAPRAARRSTRLLREAPLIPVLTVAGLNLLIMINVAVVIEVIFNWPGVGMLLYDGLTNRDFPMVQGVVLMSGVMIVALNFLIDVLYGYVDPRVRLSR